MREKREGGRKGGGKKTPTFFLLPPTFSPPPPPSPQSFLVPPKCGEGLKNGSQNKAHSKGEGRQKKMHME